MAGGSRLSAPMDYFASSGTRPTPRRTNGSRSPPAKTGCATTGCWCLLGNVDEGVYRNVFAIGLREIQELGALSDTDASRWLYELTTGADRISLVDVLAELTKARSRLLASDCAGDDSATAFRARRPAAAGDGAIPDPPVHRPGKRRELIEQITAWENEASTAERTARLIEIAASIFDKWHARQGLEKDLAATRHMPRLEQQIVTEFARLEEAFARAKCRHHNLGRQLAKNKQEMASLGLDAGVSQRAGRIESLLEQEQWITALDAERLAFAEKVAAMETHRAELCARLGFDPAGTAERGRGPWQGVASTENAGRRAARCASV